MGFVGQAIGNITGGLVSGTNQIAGSAGINKADVSNPLNTPEGQQTYNEAQDAYNRQVQFLQALQGSQANLNQSSIMGQQQNLANQFGDIAKGEGPNPAQAMLNQQTGNNIAQQAALMAGQRGAGANAGLIARQAGQMGAGLQQQAVGQGATMQAQQSLNAMQAQAAQQQAMQQVAAGQIGQQANVMQNLAGNALQGQNNVIGGQNAANNANLGNQNMMNGANQAIAGGIMNGIGSALPMMPSFGGGSAGGSGGGGGGPGSAGGAVAKGGPAMMAMAHGGQVDGPKSHVGKFLKGQINMKQGGNVPGQAQVSGDNLKNDTVPAMLSPKEIVVPRSITMSEDAPQKAAEFVASILRRKGMSKT